VTARVTANYFSLLGVSARLGRTFASEQDNVTQKFQAVISYDLGSGNSEPMPPSSVKLSLSTAKTMPSLV